MRILGNTFSSFGTVVVFSFVFLAQVVAAQTPARLNDKDLETLMNNLKDDAKSFRPRFDSAIKKSTIRKTSQAKEAQNLACTFQQQTAALVNDFKKTRKGDSVPAVLSTGNQIDKLVNDLKLDPQALGWDKIQTELTQVSNAFGIPPSATAGGSQTSAIPCVQAVGAERTKKLVEECILVSPATHPPCNGQNSCPLIIDEIKRGCSLLQQNQPSFCAEYK